MTEPITNLLRLLLIINIVPMVTIFPKATQVRIPNFPRMVTSVRPPRKATWGVPGKLGMIGRGEI
jgi:hypothetical protein